MSYADVASSTLAIAEPLICSKPAVPSDSFTIVAIFVDASNELITPYCPAPNPLNI